MADPQTMTDQDFGVGTGSTTTTDGKAPAKSDLNDQDFFGQDWRPPPPDTPITAKGTAEQFGYGAEAPFAWVAKKAGAPALPLSLDPDANPAGNFPERVARSAGNAAGVTAATMAAGATLPEDVTAGAAGVVPSAVRFGQKIIAPAPSVSGMVGGTLAGAGSEVGEEAMPEYSSPALKVLGGMGGGVGLGGIAGGLTKGVSSYLEAAAERQGLVQAGEQAGVKLPGFMQGPIRSGAANLITRFPVVGGFMGKPIVDAKAALPEQVGAAADKTATGLGTGDPAKAAATTTAGLRDWMDTASADRLTKSYARIGQAFKNGDPTDLTNTRTLAQQILSEREGALGPDNAMTPGITHVLEAATRPGGLNWNQMQLLRQELWDQPETKSNDVSRLWGALSDDMSEAAFNQGGLRGQRAADLSNDLARGIIQRRQQLQKVIGPASNPTAPENVYNTLYRAASDKPGTGNINRLAMAKKTLSSDDWDELASGAISRLGKKGGVAGGQFDPNQFINGWNTMSDQGKDLLFGSSNMSPVRKSLDAIAQLSVPAKGVGLAEATAGHTVHGGAGIFALFEAMHHGITPTTAGVAAGAVTGRLLASSLANPTTAGPLAQLVRSHAAYLAGKSAYASSQMLGAANRYAAAVGAQYGVHVSAERLVSALQGGAASTQPTPTPPSPPSP